MLRLLCLLCCFLPYPVVGNELLKLYKPQNEVQYSDLVISVQGYKVPTRMAFRGWMLMNQAEPEVRAIADQMFASGIKEVPLQTMAAASDSVTGHRLEAQRHLGIYHAG